jgi:hypothetical protein
MVSTYSGTNIDKNFVKKYSWLGILVVCVLSVPFHFLYEWLGENAIVGIFFPMNESIWEHLKLVFWPLLFWWGIGFGLYKDKKKLSAQKWLIASATALFTSMVFIVAWYYTWVNAFHVESAIIDIGSLFIAVPLAQLLAIHVYKVVRPRLLYFILAFVFILLFIGFFVWFSFFTPELPLFIPPN